MPMSELSLEEASLRLQQFGPNEIAQEKKRSPWFLFFEQFKSPLVLILIAACILAAILGERGEAIAIGAIVILNAVIGFVQEYRAENAIAALKNMTTPRATVIRSGQKQVIQAREVVVGDWVYLEAGDLVAADGKIVEAFALQINESLLSGESLPVEKNLTTSDAGKVFMGTSVVNGTAIFEVIATGMQTEFGKIAHLITTAEESLTPLQVQLKKVGQMILYLCLVIVAIDLILGLVQGRSWLEAIVFSISLAVAAVPEGMPAIVTVALALGVQRMAVLNALVRKLPSVETLGSVSVICTDKTGTLTTGNMRVRELWGDDHHQVIKVASSCCEAELGVDDHPGTGDPTELAILLAARERKIEKDFIEKTNVRIATHPFDSSRKRMSIFRQDQKLYVKGSFDSLLPLCQNTSHAEKLEAAAKAHQDMTSRGLRVLAVATGTTLNENKLELTGLVGMADPPRTEVAQAIKEARAAGIVPVMITGDHPTTAVVIAKELGLILEDEVAAERVHARVTPEDKLKLVRHWKNKGAVVAMTGDGVNDAPALREAHIGIAMGKTGTEVTRQAADLILADDNFATIIAAVREGRGVYQNIRKALTYLLIGNFGELMAVLGASLMGLPLPFLAIHLLWINLVTDALPALALIADPVSPTVMQKSPRTLSESLLGREEWTRIVVIGLLEALIVLGLFVVTLEKTGIQNARNLVFTTLVFSQLLRSFGARSRERIFWQVGALSNLWLLGVVLLTGLIQLALHFLPLTQEILGLQPLAMNELLLIGALALLPISLIELKKLGNIIGRRPFIVSK